MLGEQTLRRADGTEILRDDLDRPLVECVPEIRRPDSQSSGPRTNTVTTTSAIAIPKAPMPAQSPMAIALNSAAAVVSP